MALPQAHGGPPEALQQALALGEMCQNRLQHMLQVLNQAEAAIPSQKVAMRQIMEAADASRETSVFTKGRQSFFASYFTDSGGKTPPQSEQAKAMALHLRRMGEAMDDHGWTGTEQKALRKIVEAEKAAARTRLGISRAGGTTSADGADIPVAPPNRKQRKRTDPRNVKMKVSGKRGEGEEGTCRKTREELEEDAKVEAEVRWDKVAEKLKPFHPRRLRDRERERSSQEVMHHWKNALAPPKDWTKEEVERLVAIAEDPKHDKHGWEHIAAELGTGHAPLQCLRKYQQTMAQDLFKGGKWTEDEDERLGEAVDMFADNWTLISQHVQTRTATQCRHRHRSVGLKREKFSREESMRLTALVKAYTPQQFLDEPRKARAKDEGARVWGQIAEHLPGRTDSQCRNKWTWTLNPQKKRDPWTPEEDERLKEIVQRVGVGNWAGVAKELGGGRLRGQCKVRYWILMRLAKPGADAQGDDDGEAGGDAEELDMEDEEVEDDTGPDRRGDDSGGSGSAEVKVPAEDGAGRKTGRAKTKRKTSAATKKDPTKPAARKRKAPARQAAPRKGRKKRRVLEDSTDEDDAAMDDDESSESEADENHDGERRTLRGGGGEHAEDGGGEQDGDFRRYESTNAGPEPGTWNSGRPRRSVTIKRLRPAAVDTRTDASALMPSAHRKAKNGGDVSSAAAGAAERSAGAAGAPVPGSNSEQASDADDDSNRDSGVQHGTSEMTSHSE